MGSVTTVLMYRVAGLAKCVCSSSQEPGPGALNSICDTKFLTGFTLGHSVVGPDIQPRQEQKVTGAGIPFVPLALSADLHALRLPWILHERGWPRCPWTNGF